MEKESACRTRSTFEEGINGIGKLLNSGAITSKDAFLIAAIYAMEAIIRTDSGENDPTHPMAQSFLERHWKKIPDEIKAKFLPSKNQD
ncbi:hypothetical protein KKG52_02785 [Patescibacteria group bacterium]|nr:hypothetical protein [Patescibacteria group bacterium]